MPPVHIAAIDYPFYHAFAITLQVRRIWYNACPESGFHRCEQRFLF